MKKTLGARLLASVSWSSTASTFSMVAAFLSTILLTRLLSAVDLGTYFLLFSLATSASVFAAFGLPRTLVRLVSEYLAVNNLAAIRRVLRKSFTTAILPTVVVAALVCLFGLDILYKRMLASEPSSVIPALLAVWITGLALRMLITESFRGFHDFRLATLTGDPFTRIVFLAALLLFWSTGKNLSTNGAVAVITFSTIIPVFVGLVLLLRRYRQLPKDNTETADRVFSMSGHFLIITATTLILQQADLWLIGAFEQEDKVALYGAAKRLMLLVTAPLVIINNAIPSLVVELSKQERFSTLEKMLQSVAAIAAIPSTIVLVGFIFYPSAVMAFVYGDFYAEAGVLLAVLSAGQLVSVFTGSAGLTLAMSGYQALLMKLNALSAVVTLVLGWLVVARSGVLGLAVVFSLSTVFINLAALYMVRKKIGIWSFANPRQLSAENVRNVLRISK